MAAGNGVCGTNYLGDNAVILTFNGWNTFHNYANQSFELASNQIEALNNFNTEFFTWDASFQADGVLSGFTRPARPDFVDIDPIDITGDVPAAPSANIAPVSLSAVPAEPAYLSTPPELDFTVVGPEPLDPDDRPGSAPVLDIPDAPTEPTINVIAAPDLIEVEIDDAPLVTIEEFAELPPEFTSPEPSGVIDFAENPYISAFLDGIKERITDMMAGEGLPPEVAAALFSRGADREDASSLKLLQEVREDFAGRGYDAEPNGMLAARMMEVRQINRTKRNDLAREIYIQEQTVAIENIRFAVSNGLQLEGQLLQAHLNVEQRRFDLAVKLQDVQLAVFNAQVTAFNARVQTFNARVSAYQAFVEGQRSLVEVYKATVEAAKVRGEINLQRAQVYEVQVRAEAAKADVYRAQVDGFRARIDAERTRLEAYRTEIDAYRAFVDTYRTEWDAERTRVEAQVGRANVYQTLAGVHGTRIATWQTQAQVKIEAQRADIAAVQLLLQQHEAQVRTLLARFEAARTNVQAQIATQNAQVSVYQADVAVESAAVEADNRAYQAQTARENTRLQIRLQDVQQQLAQLSTNASLTLRALESATQASTQLTASTMSAVNFSSSVNAGYSASDNCSSSFSYSGEIADAPE